MLYFEPLDEHTHTSWAFVAFTWIRSGESFKKEEGCASLLYENIPMPGELLPEPLKVLSFAALLF